MSYTFNESFKFKNIYNMIESKSIVKNMLYFFIGSRQHYGQFTASGSREWATTGECIINIGRLLNLFIYRMLHFFPFSLFSACLLSTFCYFLSVLLFPCASVGDYTHARVPHFLLITLNIVFTL